MDRKLAYLLMSVIALFICSVGVTWAAISSIVLTQNPQGSVPTRRTIQFTARAFDENNQPVRNARFIWTSNAAAGRITSAGRFTAGGNPGVFTDAVTVRAANTDITESTNVTVTTVPTRIIVTPNPTTVTAAGTQTFNAAVLDAQGNPVNNATVTWSVTNPRAGAINSSTGEFVAGSSAGRFTNAVVASYAGRTGSATVNVVAAPPSTVRLFVNNREITQPLNLASGSRVTIVARGFDALGREIPGLRFIFGLSGNGGTIVPTTGVYTASRTANTSSTITAQALIAGTLQGARASAVINTVPGPPSRVIVSPVSQSVAINATQPFTAVVKDANGNTIENAQVTWSLANPNAGSIDANGVFTAGTTTGLFTDLIRATSTVGRRVGTATVIIIPSTDPFKIILTGRIVSSNDRSGVANVLVSFGNPAVEATTDSEGRFTLDLGNNPVSSHFLGADPQTFRIDYSSLGDTFDQNGTIIYEFSGANPESLEPSSIPVKPEVLNGSQRDLGTIVLPYQTVNDEPPVSPEE